jgi:hypothetical protein
MMPLVKWCVHADASLTMETCKTVTSEEVGLDNEKQSSWSWKSAPVPTTTHPPKDVATKEEGNSELIAIQSPEQFQLFQCTFEHDGQ